MGHWDVSIWPLFKNVSGQSRGRGSEGLAKITQGPLNLLRLLKKLPVLDWCLYTNVNGWIYAAQQTLYSIPDNKDITFKRGVWYNNKITGRGRNKGFSELLRVKLSDSGTKDIPPAGLGQICSLLPLCKTYMGLSRKRVEESCPLCFSCMLWKQSLQNGKHGGISDVGEVLCAMPSLEAIASSRWGYGLCRRTEKL